MGYLPGVKLKPHADGLQVAELTRRALEHGGDYLEQAG
jgi:hypothetical protein